MNSAQISWSRQKCCGGWDGNSDLYNSQEGVSPQEQANNYANVNPKLLRWAEERSDVTWEELTARFKKLPEWERCGSKPTYRQAELFAHKMHDK